VAFDPRASETTPEEIAPAGREEAGLESAFCRASENRPIAEYHAIMGRSANSSLEKHRRSPVETPGRLNRNRGRTLRREGTVPRIFKLISVSCGPPVDYAEFLAMLRTRETARGCDRPRDGSNSGPARRAPAAAQRRREWEFALIVLVHRDGRRAPSRP